MNRQPTKLLTLASAIALLGAACSSADTPKADSARAVATTTSKAATLRSGFNTLLSEHVLLAADATAAALGGRAEEFTAAAAALDTNSVDIATAVGAAYGTDAEAAFLAGWRKHIGFFVEYTQGVAAKDQARTAKAMVDLNQYAVDLATLLNAANGLPKDDVIALVKQHALGLTGVIDAQAAGDYAKVYRDLRTSAAHMSMLADPIAEATVRRYPGKFGG